MRAEGSTMAAGGGYGGDHTTPLPRLVFRERPPSPPSPTRLRFPSEVPATKVRHTKRRGTSRSGLVYGPRPVDWNNPLALEHSRVEEIIALYESGLSVNKVAEKTGIAKSTIMRHLRANEVEIRGSTKALDVKVLKEKFLAGASIRELAKEHGVVADTIKRRLQRAEVDLTRGVRDGR